MKKIYTNLFPNYIVISWFTTVVEVQETPVPHIGPLHFHIRSEAVKKIVEDEGLSYDCIVDNAEDKRTLQQNKQFRNVKIHVVSINDKPLFIPKKKNVANEAISEEHPWVVVALVSKNIPQLMEYWFAEGVVYDGQDLMIPPKNLNPK